MIWESMMHIQIEEDMINERKIIIQIIKLYLNMWICHKWSYGLNFIYKADIPQDRIFRLSQLH